MITRVFPADQPPFDVDVFDSAYVYTWRHAGVERTAARVTLVYPAGHYGPWRGCAEPWSDTRYGAVVTDTFFTQDTDLRRRW